MTVSSPALARMESTARGVRNVHHHFQPLVPHLPSSSSAFTWSVSIKISMGVTAWRTAMRVDLDQQSFEDTFAKYDGGNKGGLNWGDILYL
jgi:hypothetical protein